MRGANEQLNIFDNAPDWEKTYKDAIADAKLALTKSQADADDAWIDGKAEADETFLTADAAAWQLMSDDQAQTSDAFALENDPEVQAENDAIAQDESGALVAEAQADQNQGNSDASAAANFQIAQANETATIWVWIDGQMNTPWADSQAGLAATEATWAITSAANYQAYVSQLGTAEMTYANDNAAKFLTEIESIDLADRTAADGAANADEALTISLTDDEAAFEETDALAGMDYQEAIGLAQDVYRKAMAQADHDLAVYGAQSDYADQVAAAIEARSVGYDEAYVGFASLEEPAMTLDGVDNAIAEKLDTQTIAGQSLTDIETNNQAVDDYQDAESTDYDGQERSQAQALYAYEVADANGHAAAIAAFAQSNPSPWSDLASAMAAAQAALKVSEAGAKLTESDTMADDQEALEIAQNDAETAKDDAEAEAEEAQTVTDAEAQHDSEAAQAAATDAVFENLPDTLIAPEEGPTPTITGDYNPGYEAGDLTLGATMSPPNINGVGHQNYYGAPEFMPMGLQIYDTAYDWTVYGAKIPFGPLGDGGIWPASKSYDTPIVYATPIEGEQGSVGMPLQDLFRAATRVDPSMPVEAIANATHFQGSSIALLDANNTPSHIGVGGYSQSPIPTSPEALQLASTGMTSQTTQITGRSASAGVQTLSETANSGAGARSDGTPAGAGDENGASDTPAPVQGPLQYPPGDERNGNVGEVTAVISIEVLREEPDPAKERAELKDGAEGEPETKPSPEQKELAEPENEARATETALADNIGEQRSEIGSSDTTAPIQGPLQYQPADRRNGEITWPIAVKVNMTRIDSWTLAALEIEERARANAIPEDTTWLGERIARGNELANWQDVVPGLAEGTADRVTQYATHPIDTTYDLAKNATAGIVILVTDPGKAGLAFVMQLDGATPREIGRAAGAGIVDGAVTLGLAKGVSVGIRVGGRVAKFAAVSEELIVVVEEFAIDAQNSGVNEPVLFGQRRVGPKFSTDSKFPHTSGKTLAEVVADLREGRLTPDDLPLTAFRHPETGHLVSMNTRTRAVLAEAGLEPTRVEIIDLNSLSKKQRAKYLSRLTEELLIDSPLPGYKVPVTPSMEDLTIMVRPDGSLYIIEIPR